MEKIFLKFGKHKIDITKDVIGDEVRIFTSGADIGEAIDNFFCNKLERKVQKKTVLSLLRNMSIERVDKENDSFRFSCLFLKSCTDEKGNVDLTYNNRCDDSINESLVKGN